MPPRFRAKGKTAAGTHVPVLLKEVMGQLVPSGGDVVVDCTLGYGGHGSQFASRIGSGGRLIGLDADAVHLEKTKKRLSKAQRDCSCSRGFYWIT